MEEIWKDIKDFEGVYQISNMGRLRSFRRGVWYIRSLVNSKGGYISVDLISGSKIRYAKIHRLVYETFIREIPKGYEWDVHHINHDKQDNRLENLKLVTRKEHSLEHHPERRLKRHTERRKKAIIPIGQYSLDGVFIASFPNGKAASKATGVCARNINQVANKTPYNKDGKIRKQAGGYIWRLLK